MFICDILSLVGEFLRLARTTVPSTENKDGDELKIIQNNDYKRLESTIDMKLALKLYNTFRSDCFDEESRLKKCSEDLKTKLEELNNIIIEELNSHISSAIENSISTMRYNRLLNNGPKIQDISLKNPLVFR